MLFRPTLLLAVILILISNSGCMGPGFGQGYGGYNSAPGYSTYPGTGYPAGGAYPQGMNPGYYDGGAGYQTLTPGPTYTPGVGVPVNPGNGVTPTYAPNGGNADPYYGSGASRPVPPPADARAIEPTHTPQPGDEYFPPGGVSFEDDGSGVNRSAGLLTPTPDSSTQLVRPRHEALPISMSRAFPESDSSPSLTPPAAITGEYAHDANFGWVQGVVTYDATDRTWSIIYDLAPSSEDQYSGHFTLADSSALQVLRDGEFVRLEGQVQQDKSDRQGKAMYELDRIVQSHNGPTR